MNVGVSNVARTINLGTGTGIDTINIGTGGTGADVINIGSANAGAVTVRSNAALALYGAANSLIDFTNFDVDTTGNLISQGYLYADGAFSVGDTTPDSNAYNTIGTSDAGSGQVTDGADLFVSDDVEIDGQLFVDTSLVLGGDTITDFVGSGLSLSG